MEFLLPLLGIVAVAVVVALVVVVREMENRLLDEPEVSADDRKAERKRRAKRVNERLKLSSSFISSVGVAFFATSVLAPLAATRRNPSAGLTVHEALLALVIVIILHASAQIILHFWKSED